MFEAVGVPYGYLGLPLTLWITYLLWFVGVVPMIMLLSYFLLHVLCAEEGGDWMSEGVSEAVGVSSGCLGLPLMLYITCLLWFMGVDPMILLTVNLAIFCCR